MEFLLFFMPFFVRTVLASSDLANYTLRPFDEEILTTPSLRSLPPPSPSFGENSDSYGSGFGNQNFGSGSNQQSQGPSVQQPFGFPMSQYGLGGPAPSPFGPPIAPLVPVSQLGQSGFPPVPFGQQTGYPWQQQGPFQSPFFGGWPGVGRPQQFNPFVQQQPNVFPTGFSQMQYGQQPMQPIPNSAPSFPFNPYQAMGPPPPPPGYFQGGPGPQSMDNDDRFNWDRRNYEYNQSPFGQQMSIGRNPSVTNLQSGPRGAPLFPVPPAFPGEANRG